MKHTACNLLFIIALLATISTFSQTDSLPVKAVDSEAIQQKNFEKKLADLEKQRLIDSLKKADLQHCLLYTSPSPRDRTRSRMPSSA